MRKQLLAFLSMLGLASSSAPASAQVLKGSQPPDTKSESTIKASKTAQETAAGKNAKNLKSRKAGISPDVGTGMSKATKANAEKSSAVSAAAHKRTKTTATDDWENTGATGGSKTGRNKAAGNDDWMQTEVTSHKKNVHNKVTKNTAENKTVQQDANQKTLKQTGGQPH